RGAMGNPFLFKKTVQYLKYGRYDDETADERIKTGFRELELNVQEKGEKNACMQMRKKFCAYSSGIKGGALLRKQVVSADTIEEYRRIFAVYLE
ncbi:MAG: tRNA-dihydrouridine synthase, partial [Treponema sp.]|nr:tRNA-dihydrouridine synthase [Treponema sp.]